MDITLLDDGREQHCAKLVLTGGPCGGKSTAIHLIRDAYTKRGFKVILVAETATELINGGIINTICNRKENYQMNQMKLQLAKEAAFRDGASFIQQEKVLMICDRGMMDNKAYLTTDEFASILSEMDLTEQELMDRYDAVFHLVSCAKGAAEHYSRESNAARQETPEEAEMLDDRILDSWQGHPRLYVIDNSTDFSGKLERLMNRIDETVRELF